MHAPLAPNDPARIGPYRLESRIGRGGMGTVYLAVDESGPEAAGRRVAVKVINPELAGDAGFQARFRREVTAARKVRRFCTAAVLDADLDGDPVYVVTEYVEGPTLAAAVRERGPLRGGDLDSLAVGIATALTAIHGAGIVHRDLKPANVLLSPTGPRVIDFGIARALDAVDGPTRTGQFVGTPSYVAPEVLRGAEVTQAADVFAWGCVVMFAGTGRTPFAGGPVQEVLYRVSHESPDLAGLDPSLVELVAEALDKDPAKRPGTQELLDRLTGRTTPVGAALPPPGPAPVPAPAPATTVEPVAEAAPPRRRRRKAVFAGLAAFLCLGAVGGVVGWTGLSGTDPRDAKPPVTGTAFYPLDGFDSSRGWDEDDCGSYNNAALEIAADEESGEQYCTLPDRRSVADGRTLHEVKVAFAAGGSSGYAGLYVLHKGDSRYEVMLRWDGMVRLRKIVKDRPVPGAVRDAELRGFQPQQANRLQVEVDLTGRETVLRVWVNRRHALTFDDGGRPLRQGTDSLAVVPTGQGDNSELTAVFDDFAISRSS